MKALIFQAPHRGGRDRYRPSGDRPRRGPRQVPRGRHLPFRLRALRGPLHHPRLLPDHPRARVVRRGGRGRPGRRGPQPGRPRRGECVVGPADATTSASRSTAPTPSTSRPGANGCTSCRRASRFTEGAMVEPLSVAYNADGPGRRNRPERRGRGPRRRADRPALRHGRRREQRDRRAARAPGAPARARHCELGATAALDPGAGDFADGVARADRRPRLRRGDRGGRRTRPRWRRRSRSPGRRPGRLRRHRHRRRGARPARA